MVEERSSQRRVRHVLRACGAKEMVVSAPAAKPSVVMMLLVKGTPVGDGSIVISKTGQRRARSNHFSTGDGAFQESSLSIMASGVDATTISSRFSARMNFSFTAW